MGSGLEDVANGRDSLVREGGSKGDGLRISGSKESIVA